MNINKQKPKTTFQELVTEMVFFDYNNEIDFKSSWNIIEEAINSKLFPGAQALIIKDGNILGHKSFGHLTFDINSKKLINILGE